MARQAAAKVATLSNAADKAALQGAMQRLSLLPLWEIYEKVVTHQPSLDAPAHLWKWSDLQPAVDLTLKTVHGKDADHRVLVLKNPHYRDRVTTANNILGAVQCVLPGERTSPHRHTPAAVRLVLEGEGGGTFVDGMRCDMYAGDFIVTPNWTWHGHHNDSASPVTWVDILDVPMVRHHNAVFGEYGPKGYPENVSTLVDGAFARGGLVPQTDRPSVPYTPRFRYAWADVQALLDAMPVETDGSKRVRYTNPLDGGPVIPTLDASALRIAKGKPTRAVRSTASELWVVIDGKGASEIGGVTHQWEARDIFTVPEWSWVSHRASTAKAHLLRVSDRGVREALGLYREERA